MHINIARQDLGTCATGTGSYYVCGNGFRGCCTVDACSLSTCPDKVSSSSASIVTTLIVSAQPASSSINTTPSTATALTSHSTTTGSTFSTSTPHPTPLSTPATTSSLENGVVAALPATSASSSATSTNAANPASTSSSSHTGLIAGVVCGIVALSILSVLGWFCIRRHQVSKERRNTSKSYSHPSPTKDFFLDSSNSGETEALRKSQSDVFAAFGGRYKSPRSEAAELAHSEIQGGSIDENEDRALPDIEKARVKTPPVHEHPAYAPSSSNYQPSIASHPAYHVSKLNTHPAFRSVHVSHVPPSRSNQSIRATYQIATPRPGQMDEVISEVVSPLISSPLISSPLISSPIAGHSELEAEVPASYISSTASNALCQNSAMQQNTSSSQGSECIEISPLPASISIGLGVGITPDSATSSSPAPNLPPPSTIVQASNLAWPNNSSPAPRPPRTSSRPSTFIPSSGEIVSKIQRPSPRSSNNSLQNAPIISHLQPARQLHSSWPAPTYRYSISEEKEMGLSVPEGSHPSQRWSDATMVTPAPSPRHQNSISVPDLIAAANLGISPDPTVAGRNSESGDEGRTPTSAFTDGTATWGSWAAR